MVACTHLVFFDTKVLQPVDTELTPVLEPVKIGSRFAEELQLHLLELSGTEGEVTRSDLVTEGFSDLSDSEGNFLSGGSLYILEVYEDTLCGLRTEIYRILCILGHALEGFEHQVELTDVCEIVFSAGGAGDLVLFDEVLHFFLAPGIHGILKLDVVVCAEVLDKLVCTETLMTLLQSIRGSEKPPR